MAGVNDNEDIDFGALGNPFAVEGAAQSESDIDFDALGDPFAPAAQQYSPEVTSAALRLRELESSPESNDNLTEQIRRSNIDLARKDFEKKAGLLTQAAQPALPESSYTDIFRANNNTFVDRRLLGVTGAVESGLSWLDSATSLQDDEDQGRAIRLHKEAIVADPARRTPEQKDFLSAVYGRADIKADDKDFDFGALDNFISRMEYTRQSRAGGILSTLRDQQAGYQQAIAAERKNINTDGNFLKSVVDSAQSSAQDMVFDIATGRVVRAGAGEKLAVARGAGVAGDAASAAIRAKAMADATSAGALSSMAVHVYGQTRAEGIAEGLSPAEAEARARWFTATEYATELLPLDMILKGKVDQGVIKKALKASGAEGLSEIIATGLQSGYDHLNVEGKEITLGELLEQMAHAGATGALVGGSVSVLADATGTSVKQPGKADSAEDVMREIGERYKASPNVKPEGYKAVDAEMASVWARVAAALDALPADTAAPVKYRTVREMMTQAGITPAKAPRNDIERIIAAHRNKRLTSVSGETEGDITDIGADLRKMAGLDETTVDAPVEKPKPARFAVDDSVEPLRAGNDSAEIEYLQRAVADLDEMGRIDRTEFNADAHSLSDAVAFAGGLDRAYLGGEVDIKTANAGRTGRPVVRVPGAGLTPDHMAERLNELGFRAPGGEIIDPNNLMEMLADEAGGKKHFSQSKAYTGKFDEDRGFANLFSGGDSTKLAGAIRKYLAGGDLGLNQRRALKGIIEYAYENGELKPANAGSPQDQAAVNAKPIADALVGAGFSIDDKAAIEAAREAYEAGVPVQDIAEAIRAAGGDPADVDASESRLEREVRLTAEDRAIDSADGKTAIVVQAATRLSKALNDVAGTRKGRAMRAANAVTPKRNTGNFRQPYDNEIEAAIGEAGTAAWKANVTPEQAAAMFDALFPRAHIDPTTGFYKNEQRAETMVRAIEYLKRADVDGFYVEIDLANLNGRNKALGHSGADKSYRATARIISSALTNRLGKDVAFDQVNFRHGGDEMSFFVFGKDIDLSSIEDVLRRAQETTWKYDRSLGLHEIEHAKHKGDETKIGGGFYFGVAKIDPEKTIDENFSAADKLVERQKEEPSYGYRKREAARAARPDAGGKGGQAEGAGRGERGIPDGVGGEQQGSSGAPAGAGSGLTEVRVQAGQAGRDPALDEAGSQVEERRRGDDRTTDLFGKTDQEVAQQSVADVIAEKEAKRKRDAERAAKMSDGPLYDGTAEQTDALTAAKANGDGANWIGADAQFTVTVGEEYGTAPVSDEAIAFIKSAAAGSTALETGVRPSGKENYTLYVSNGDGTYSSEALGNAREAKLADVISLIDRKNKNDTEKKSARDAEREKRIASDREVAKANGYMVGSALGTIIPNTGKQMRAARIIADHGDGTFDVSGIAGNKDGIIRGLSAEAIARAVSRAGGTAVLDSWKAGESLATQNETEASAILDAADVRGKDRLEAMEKFRAGTYTLDDLKGAYPPKAAVQPTPTAERKAAKVTPQTASERQLNSMIAIAADSIGELRSVDVDRVLSEAPAHFRLSLAQHIKSKRKDLAGAVDEAMSDIADEGGVSAPAQDQKPKESNEARVLRELEVVRNAQLAIAADWQGRVYKNNSAQVDLRGDGPRSTPSISIGAANESRRRNAIEAATKTADKAKELQELIGRKGYEFFILWVDGLRNKVQSDADFEEEFLRQFNFRGPGGKGNVISNELSKAVIAEVNAYRARIEKAREIASESADGWLEAMMQPVTPAQDEKSLAAPGVIDDFGEKLGGARKDKAAAQREAIEKEFSDEEIATLPLSKIWPKGEVDDIEDTYAAAVAHAARQEIPAKPRQSYKVRVWVQKVRGVRNLAQWVLGGAYTKEAFNEKLRGFNSGSLEHFADKVALLEMLDRKHWDRIGKVAVYPNAQRRVDGKDVTIPMVSVEVDGRRYYMDASGLADAVDAIREKLGDGATEKQMKFEVRGSNYQWRINKVGDPLYRPLKTFTDSKEALAYVRNNNAELVAAWEALKERQNVKQSDVRRDTNRQRTAQNWRGEKSITRVLQALMERADVDAKVVSDRLVRGAGSSEGSGQINVPRPFGLADWPDEPDGVHANLRKRSSYMAVVSLNVLRNLAETPSISIQLRSKDNIPLVSAVQEAMLALGHNQKVLRSIVERIPVEVMDFLAREKISPERLFSDKSVLKTLLTVKSGVPVAGSGSDPVVALMRQIAGNGAEVVGTDNPARIALENDSALVTGQIDGGLEKSLFSHDVSPEDFLSEFSFRGVEFGNWVGQGKSAKERQGMLNEAYDALMDLADITGIPPKAVSLSGSLGLGFGSRGHGWASAHFEPGTLVINLTKTRGAGALAHEWFHALDNHFQLKRGTPANNEAHNHFITYAPENYYTHKQSGLKLPEKAFEKMIDGERDGRYGSIAKAYRDRAQWEFKPGVRTEVAERFAELVTALNDSPMAKRSRLIDKGKSDGYWSSIIEMAARSFENYVIHKMMLKGYHNDYLANVTAVDEFQRDTERYPYLLTGEIAPVAEAFDALFATTKTRTEADGRVSIYEPARGYNGDAVHAKRMEVESGKASNLQRRRVSAATEQGDLFTASAVPAGEQRAAAAADIYHVTVEHEEVGRVDVGHEVIDTPEKAAWALRHLGRRAQEQMVALVTDKDGKPISLISHTSGVKNASQVDPGGFVGAIVAQPGARNVWLAHNHPGGDPTPSQADRAVTNKVADIISGSGVAIRGHIVVGNNEAWHFDARGLGDWYGAPISSHKAPAGKEISIVERFITKRGDGGQINGPDDAVRIASGLKGDGVMLLDNRLRVVGFVPMTSDDMVSLRNSSDPSSSTPLYRLLVAMDKTNAGSMIVVGGSKDAAENIATFGNAVDATVHDWISNGVSKGVVGRTDPFLSLSKKSSAAGVAIGDVRKEIESLKKAIPGLDVSVVQSVNDLPAYIVDHIDSLESRGEVDSARLEGVFDPVAGRCYVVADNLSSAQRGAAVALHENVAHFGTRVLLGDRHESVMLEIEKSFRGRQDFEEVRSRYQLTGNLDRKARAKAADEFVARLAENGTLAAMAKAKPLGPVGRLFRAIRDILQRIGLVDWNDADIERLLARAVDAVNRERAAATGERDLQLSVASTWYFSPLASALTGKEYGRKLALSSDTLGQLRERFGSIENWWRDEFGHDFSGLTESEGRFLLGLKGRPSPDAVRDRILEARDESLRGVGARDDSNGKDQGSVAPLFSLSGASQQNINTVKAGQEARSNKGEWDALYKDVKSTQAVPESRAMIDRVRDAYSHLNERNVLAMEQGIIDQFASIKALEKAKHGNLLDADQSAWKAALLTQNLSGVMAAIINSGQPKFDGKWFSKDPDSESFSSIFEPLAKEPGLLRMWEHWAGAVRAKRLLREGREQNYTQEQVDRVLAFVDERPELSALFNETHRRWREFNKRTLDMAEAAGVVDPVERKLWENDDYVPFHRVIEDQEDSTPRGPLKKRGLEGQSSGIRRLAGSDAKVNIFESMLLNTMHLVDASYKNVAMQRISELADGIAMERIDLDWKPVSLSGGQLAEALKKSGVDVGSLSAEQRESWLKVFTRVRPEGNDVVSVMRNGKREWYRVTDPLLLASITAIGPEPYSLALEILGAPKRLLTTTVTAMPGFMIANSIRDTLSTWQTISLTGLPGEYKTKPVTDAIRGAVRSLKDSDDQWALMFSGASSSGFYNTHPADVRQQMREINGMANTLSTPKKAWRAWMRFGRAFENANRLAVYENVKKAGGSDAEAAFQAMDVINFSKRGSWKTVRFLVAIVPFLNARIQGQNRLYRGFRHNKSSFILKGLALSAVSLLVMAMNEDDERYWALEEWDRDMYWHFWVGRQHFRVPKPFEAGAIFGTTAERFYAAMKGNDDGKDLQGAAMRFLQSSFGIQIPQAALPLAEVAMNYSTFRQSPIMPSYMADFYAPEDQYDPDKTSLTSRAAAELMPDFAPDFLRSPMKLEHLLRGYFGTLGTELMKGSDWAFRNALDMPDTPTMEPWQYPIVGRFWRTGYDGTKYVGEFYDMLGDAEEEKNGVDKLTDEMMKDRAAKRKEERRYTDAELKTMREARTKMSEWRSEIDEILMSTTIHPDVKRDRISALQKKRNDKAKQTLEKFAEK